MSYYIRKNGVTKKLAVIPQGYPAELLSYDNTGTNLQSDNAQDAITELDSGKVSKSGDTMSGKLTINRQNGTSSSIGYSQLELGNNIAEGTQNNSAGLLKIFGKNSYNGMIYDLDGLTDDRNYYLPDKSGTLALTSDITDRVKVYTKTFYCNQGTASIPFTLPSTSARHTLQIIIGATGLILSINNSGIVSQNTFGLSSISASYNTETEAIDLSGGEWYTTGFIISSKAIE